MGIRGSHCEFVTNIQQNCLHARKKNILMNRKTRTKSNLMHHNFNIQIYTSYLLSLYNLSLYTWHKNPLDQRAGGGK